MEKRYPPKGKMSDTTTSGKPIVSGAKGHKPPRDSMPGGLSPLKSGFSKGKIDTTCA